MGKARTPPDCVLISKGRGWVIVAFAVWLAAEPTRAGSLVEFDNVPEYAKPARLAGYLAQPDGVGPFPAVVVLHGCGGISSHSIGIADQLSFSGYVGLAVDSLGPRGMADACGQFFIGRRQMRTLRRGFSRTSPLSTPTGSQCWVSRWAAVRR